MVESTTVHSTTPQQAASWRPGPSNSAAAKGAVTAPPAAETSVALSCTPTTVAPISLQAPCTTEAVGVQAIPWMSGTSFYDVRPNYQLAYALSQQARVGFPCFQGVLQSPQVFLQGQPADQPPLGSAPQGVASQSFASSGFPAFQHDGTRQLQTSTLPVQVQLSGIQQPPRLVFQQQVLPSKQIIVPHVQASAQGIPAPAMHALRVVPPECVKTVPGTRTNGSISLPGQQVVHNMNSLKLLSHPTVATGGLAHVVVPGIQPEAQIKGCNVSVCPTACAMSPTDNERLTTQSTYPACFNFTSVQQQPTTNHGSPAVPVYYTCGQQSGPWFPTTGTVASVGASTSQPGVVLWPWKSWDPQSFPSSNAVAGGTQITVIPGTPVSSLCSVGLPTASVAIGAPFQTQQSSGIPGVAPVLPMLPLGSPSGGAVQLLQTDARFAACPSSLPTSINVVPSSLATILPGDTFTRRKRGQPAGTARCRSFCAQPFASCGIPTADNHR